MTDLNPYQSPTLPAEAPQEASRSRPANTVLGFCFLVLSTGAALAYCYFDEAVLGTHIGGWPMLIGTAVLSIVSAFMSRHLVLAPLCCFAGIIAADLLVAVLISVAYAQFDNCFPLAVTFSLPSLIIVLALRRTDRSRIQLLTTS